MQKSRAPAVPRRMPALLSCAAALLAGCAQLEWQKPGVGAADAERDHAQCSAQARGEAQRRMPLLHMPGQRTVTDQQGRVVAVQPVPDESERFLLEQDLVRLCMTRLGYALLPVPPAAGPR